MRVPSPRPAGATDFSAAPARRAAIGLFGDAVVALAAAATPPHVRVQRCTLTSAQVGALAHLERTGGLERDVTGVAK